MDFERKSRWLNWIMDCVALTRAHTFWQGPASRAYFCTNRSKGQGEAGHCRCLLILTLQLHRAVIPIDRTASDAGSGTGIVPRSLAVPMTPSLAGWGVVGGMVRDGLNQPSGRGIERDALE
jgi:hypothetical protein